MGMRMTSATTSSTHTSPITRFLQSGKLLAFLWMATTDANNVRHLTQQRRVRTIRGSSSVGPSTSIVVSNRQYHRYLPKKSHSHSSGSSYLGCLAYSDSQLDDMWLFPGQRPSCEYTHHPENGSDQNNGNNSNGGSSNQGSDGSSNQDNGADSNQESGNEGNDGNNGDQNQDQDNSNNDGSNNNGNNNSDESEQEGRNNYEEVIDNSDFDNDYEDAKDNQNGNNNNGGNNNQGQLDPYVDFDIEQCNTYENLWLWDFSITCESEDSLDSCQCLFAEQLLQLGLLSCDEASSCPAECRICETCMRLMGCEVPDSGSKSNFGSSGSYIFVIAAAIGILVFGGIVVARRRRREGPLNAYLMEDDGSDASPPPASSPVPDTSTTAQGVWLAPDDPVTQFGPSLGVGGVVDGETSSNDDNVWLAPLS